MWEPSQAILDHSRSFVAERVTPLAAPGVGLERTVPSELWLCLLFWYVLTSGGQSYQAEEAVAPVAILPSPPGYFLRVAGAMERWRPSITRGECFSSL